MFFLPESIFNHFGQLILLPDLLDLRELDPVAHLLHVVHQKLSSLLQWFVHQVLSIVEDTIENEEAGISILEI